MLGCACTCMQRYAQIIMMQINTCINRMYAYIDLLLYVVCVCVRGCVCVCLCVRVCVCVCVCERAQQQTDWCMRQSFRCFRHWQTSISSLNSTGKKLTERFELKELFRMSLDVFFLYRCVRGEDGVHIFCANLRLHTHTCTCKLARARAITQMHTHTHKHTLGAAKGHTD